MRTHLRSGAFGAVMLAALAPERSSYACNGDGACAGWWFEDPCSCPSDCPPLPAPDSDGCCLITGVAGNMGCSNDPDCACTVPGDTCVPSGGAFACLPSCGDAFCDAGWGETYCRCPADCAERCGDGCCTGTEDVANCDGAWAGGDCAGSCGDGLCTAGEDCSWCYSDCPCPPGWWCNEEGFASCFCFGDGNECRPPNCPETCCADGSCEGAEDTCNCAQDCGPCCEDLPCNETCTICAGLGQNCTCGPASSAISAGRRRRVCRAAATRRAIHRRRIA